MHCISCGTQLPSNVAHCPQCGAVTTYNVSASGVSPDSTTAISSSSVATEIKQPVNTDGYSDVTPSATEAPLENPYDNLFNPYAPPPPPPRRRIRPALLVVVVVATLIIASGGIIAGFVLGTKNTSRSNTPSPSMTVSSNNSTATTGTAQSTVGPSPVTTLAASTSNPYPPYSGTLAVNVSFTGVISTWDASSTCQFSNHVYSVKTSRGFGECKDNVTSDSYSNFVYQAQMQFLTQDTCGGLLFRNQINSLFADYYEFYICTDGTYHLGVVGGLYNSLAGGSSLFNTGVGQANIIAVKAQGAQLTIYINGQMVNHASDTHFDSGGIAVFAANGTNMNATDIVAFNGVKVWTL